MRLAAAAAAVLAALALAACGGDDEESAAETGATGAEGGLYDISASEFISLLQPDKEKALDALRADGVACEGSKGGNSLTLLVTATALDADPDAPLSEVAAEAC